MIRNHPTLPLLVDEAEGCSDEQETSLPPSFSDEGEDELQYKIVCEGYELFIATNKPSWHTEISMNEWRMKMLNPKEWGDETFLVLASELLHVNIQIIPAFSEVTILKSSSESSNKHPLWLFHFSEVDFYSPHYQSVKPSLPVSNCPVSVLAEPSSVCPPPAAILVQPVKKKRGRPPGSKNNQKTSEDLKMPFGYIYVNNKAVVYGRFVKQITEFKEKTGVDEIRLTEDEKK